MTVVVNLRDFPRNGRGRYGRDLPPDVRRIDRRGPWGNPFTMAAAGLPASLFGVDLPATREAVIERFRDYAVARLERDPMWLDDLRGCRLACWCAPLACHGDVLLELANRP